MKTYSMTSLGCKQLISTVRRRYLAAKETWNELSWYPAMKSTVNHLYDVQPERLPVNIVACRACEDRARVIGAM